MGSPFEELHWESASKEQDSLVFQLFGEVSGIVGNKTSVFPSEDGLNGHSGNKVAGKGEKRKEINDNDIIKNPKKKRKEKNKHETGQKLTSQSELTQDSQSETRICKDSDEWVKCAKGPNCGAIVQSVNEITETKKEKIKALSINKSAKTKPETERLKNKQKSKRSRDKFKTDETLNSQVTEKRERAVIDSVDHVEQAGGIESTTLSMALDKRQLSDDVAGKVKNTKRKKTKEKGKKVAAQSSQKRKKTKNEEEQESSGLTQNRSLQHYDRPPPSYGKSMLHEKMTKQLESSRFRWINEQLYTTTGEEAVTMFSEDPSLFDVYHRGFTNQVKQWPVNPVDKIIDWLKKRATSDVVADFGCGEAVISQSVKNTVHSFDLVAKNKFVTVCNMAKVPLKSASVDVAVFCLSLMGTNLVDYLREAHRVLKFGGFLKVAEVTSRIADTTEFAKSLSRLGFQLQNEDSSNKMFVLFDFIKDKESPKTLSWHKLAGLKLKPCIYKKR